MGQSGLATPTPPPEPRVDLGTGSVLLMFFRPGTPWRLKASGGRFVLAHEDGSLVAPLPGDRR